MLRVRRDVFLQDPRHEYTAVELVKDGIVVIDFWFIWLERRTYLIR